MDNLLRLDLILGELFSALDEKWAAITTWLASAPTTGS